MLTPQIIAYVRGEMSKGVSDEVIAAGLASVGWGQEDIANIFIAVRTTVTIPPPTSVPPPKPVSPFEPSPARIIDEVTVDPVAQSVPTQTAPQIPFTESTKKILLFSTIGFCFFLLIASGVAYAYMHGIGPFKPAAPYSEGNLFSGISKAVQTIQTSSYSLSGELKVEPRDKDATPFSIHPSNEADLQAKYQNDVTRLSNATSIMRALTWMHPATSSYPMSLDTIPSNQANRYYTASLSILDPVTHQPYHYVVSPDGKSFELSVIFDTDYPITAARAQAKSSIMYTGSGQQVSTQPVINGRTLTFTNTTAYYGLYLPYQLPKPYFEQLEDMTKNLPVEMNAHAGITALADWTKKQSDWKFNVDAAGDFGDLTYKINIDALRKDEDYYFRINNLPSLLMGFVPLKKGDWIKIAHNTPTSSSPYSMYNPVSSFANSMHTGEEEYQKTRDDVIAFDKAVMQIADQTKVFRFKNPPTLETVDGKKLFKYDLEPQKDAVLPFYKLILAEAKKYPSTAAQPLFADQSMLDYLSSPEFDQVFDYYVKNTSLTLWVDPTGMPARFEYSMRIVPPDIAAQLAGKQARLTITLKMSDINAPVNIDAPKDAKPLEDVMQQSGGGVLGSLEAARTKGKTATVKSYLNNLRAQAELFYDGNKNSYAGFCDTRDVQSVNAEVSAAINSTSSVACSATASSYTIYAPLPEASSTYYCIDSTGMATNTNIPTKGKSCSGSNFIVMPPPQKYTSPTPVTRAPPQTINVQKTNVDENQMRAISQDGAIKAELNKLAAIVSDYQQQSPDGYNGFCSSVPVRSANEHIYDGSDYKSTVMCNTTSTTFRAYAELMTDRSTFYCVDSVGNKNILSLPIPAGNLCVK